MNSIPTPKTITGFSVGTLTAFVLYELNTRFNIALSGEEASFLTTAISFIASYFAPRSAPTDQQISELPLEQIAAVHPNLTITK